MAEQNSSKRRFLSEENVGQWQEFTVPPDRRASGARLLAHRRDIPRPSDRVLPHYGTELWHDFPLARTLSDALGHKPARLINDAEMQGLAAISGSGLELVLTLGTGAGTALFRDGALMPHLELAHHPVHKSKTYNDYIGKEALKRSGRKAWNRRVEKVIAILAALLNYDRLYIGGGNAQKISLKLPANVTRVTNDAGLEGGGLLWRQEAER